MQEPKPPGQEPELQVLVPERVREPASWRVQQPEQPHSMPTDLLAEEPPEPLKIALHLREQPVSSSCILQEQEPWSEQTLLPGVVALRACIFLPDAANLGSNILPIEYTWLDESCMLLVSNRFS